MSDSKELPTDVDGASCPSRCYAGLRLSEWRVLRQAIDKSDALDCRFSEARHVECFTVILSLWRASLYSRDIVAWGKENCTEIDFTGFPKREERAAEYFFRAMRWACGTSEVAGNIERILCHGARRVRESVTECGPWHTLSNGTKMSQS